MIFWLIFFMDTKKKTIQIYFHLHFIVDNFFLLIISLEHFAFCLLIYVLLLFSPQSHDENFDLAPKLFSIKLFILYDNFHLNIFRFYVVRLAFATGFPHSDELPRDDEMLPEQECLQASCGDAGFDNPDS